MAKRIEVALVEALEAVSAKPVIEDKVSKFIVGESEIVRASSKKQRDPETGRPLFSWATTDKALAGLTTLLNEANVSVRESNSRTAVTDIMVTANAEDGGRVFLNPTDSEGDEFWTVGPKLEPRAA